MWPRSGLCTPAAWCRRMEVTPKQFCPVGHNALLSSYMLRMSSHFKLFSLCKCFSLLLPFNLTGDKLTSFPPGKSALTVAGSAELWSHNVRRVGDLPVSQFLIKETDIQQSGVMQCSCSCSRDPVLIDQKAQHRSGLPWKPHCLLGMAALSPFLPRTFPFPPHHFPDSIFCPPKVCCMDSEEGKRYMFQI